MADAEKAYVSVLQLKYKKQRYDNYPYSTEGLSGIRDSRIFTIQKKVRFQTATEYLDGYGGPQTADHLLPDAMCIGGTEIAIRRTEPTYLAEE